MTSGLVPNAPLVGRNADLAALLASLKAAESGHGSAVLVVGEGGIGKTRLAQAIAEQAERRGWVVAAGRAYPLETGVPYGLFADALVPLLQSMDTNALSVLARGGLPELSTLFPTLNRDQTSNISATGTDPAEAKGRALWNLLQLLQRMAAQQPMLIILENLQWADASSLELLHLLARQLPQSRIMLLGTYNDSERNLSPLLRTTEQSLVAQGAATVRRLRPLSREETDELISRAFGVEGVATREFTALLYGWTRGNPFFIEETLKALLASGRLRQQAGVWVGWDVSELELPGSIREAVVSRLARLSPAARSLADLAAVSAANDSYEELRTLSGLPEAELLRVLDELRAQRVLEESLQGNQVVYDFTHPIVRETLYSELGLARSRSLHASVAEALEQFYGARADEHANELAYHFARAGGTRHGDKAVRYLVTAGRKALHRHANREAASYLAAALERVENATGPGESIPDNLLEDLARARQRIGEYDEAVSLWQRARADALRANDMARVAAIERRLGLACYWTGQHDEALQHFEAAMKAAAEAGAEHLSAGIHISRGACFQELGRADDARREIEQAMASAERLKEPELLARVHHAMLLLYIWIGPPERARQYGQRAIELAESVNARVSAGYTHWALAALGGLTGDVALLQHHLHECEKIAEEVGSPILRLHADEVAIEFASGSGDWDTGIALGERAIGLARALNQRMVLTRIMVWTALMYIGRDDLARAKALIDEAWHTSNAGREDAGDRPLDIHAVVPAHVGRASYHLAMAEPHEAIRVAEAGLAITERTGYIAWTVHRLLPVLGEAYLWIEDVENARRVSQRLRRESERLGHRLGLAWADACDALVVWRAGDSAGSIPLMRAAAEALEKIPHITDAARLRRQMAGRMADIGARDDAIQELRRVHDTFARIGAERELRSTRDMFRQVGARPPARADSGLQGLTERELDILRHLMANKTNKAIGKALSISPRTVSTHLANVFRKLNVQSREDLVQLLETEGLPHS